MIHKAAATLLVLASITLVGCGSDSDSSASSGRTSTTAAGGASASASSGRSSTSASSARPSTPTTPTTQVPTSVRDMEQFSECIIGKWSESPDQIERLFTDTSMARLPGFSAHATGEGSVEFRRDGTYTYAPAFAVEIRFIGQSGTGQWGGTLEGTWSVEGSTLTMAQTNNQLTGSLRVMGSEQPMPRLKTFDGTGKVDACTPATFTYEITTPIGAVAHTLVNVG